MMGYSSDSDDDIAERNSSADFEPPRIEFSEDGMKRVIVKCVSKSVKDKGIELLDNLPPKNKATILPLLRCMSDSSNDKKTCLDTITHLLFDPKRGATALHYAADQASYILIASLLDNGLDPNVRCSWNHNMNRALPLNVVLELMARHISKAYPGKLSAFKLVCEICSRCWRPSLECVRFLAPQTRELNDEIINYMKQGKVIELCALMLLGYNSRVAAVLDFVELDDSTEEQVLQLIQTFSRIGYKLQTYVALKSSPFGHCVSGLVSEIASMFNDAGLPLSNADNMVYHGSYISELKYKSKREMLSFMRECSSPTVHNATLGSRSLHTCSALKAQKGLLDEALENQKRSGSTLVHVPKLANTQNSIVASICSSARQFHTSSKFNLRKKELKGQLAKVGKPQLPAFRMCTLLFSIAKRGFYVSDFKAKY